MGSPDGGVEAFWRYPDGAEWAIQAKFFPDRIDWRQLDKSFERALETHPKLRRYTFCVPKNLSDPRPNLASARRIRTEAARWRERQQAYEDKAVAAGFQVEVDLWDDTELLLRLTKEENCGRCAFWFDAQHFDDAWFADKFAAAKLVAGRRYSPKINIDTVGWIISALSQDEKFRELAFSHHRALLKAADWAPNEMNGTPWEMAIRHVRQRTDSLLGILAKTNENPLGNIDWDAICNDTGAIRTLLAEIERALDEKEPQYYENYRTQHSNLRHFLSLLSAEISKLLALVSSDEAHVNRKRCLALVGEGGQGKTHSFCDAVHDATTQKRPALLFFGERFREDRRPVWTVVADQLSLHLTREELLGALDAAGEASGARSLVLIDALNETRDDDYWKVELADLMVAIERYPNVALAVSIRDTHERSILAEFEDSIPKVSHPGFSGNEFEAQAMYFNAYQIEEPAMPMLAPEFANPLFLKLFCESVQRRGSVVPRGVQGITALFSDYLDSVSKTVAKRRDDDPFDKAATSAVHALTARMASRRVRALPYAEARDLLQRYETRNLGHEKSIFNILLDEGVLSSISGRGEMVVRFTYERFADHLRAAHILDEILETVPSAGQRDALQHLLTGDSWDLVGALCVQIPERFGIELPDLVEERDREWAVHVAIRLLPLREPRSISDAIREEIAGRLRRGGLSADDLDALLMAVASSCGPLDYKWLTYRLTDMSMRDRDAAWTMALNIMDADSTAPMRIMRWVLRKETALDADASRAIAVIIAWFLTASNRKVRDRATKALVRVFEFSPVIVPDVVIGFAKCNDHYVVERVLAAAYGAVLRGMAKPPLMQLAATVARNCFNDAGPPVHLLARDYARGIVERALLHGLEGINVQSIRPPYGSSAPDLRDTQILDKLDWKEATPWGLRALRSSLSRTGDFARYILHADTPSGFPWINIRLTEPPPQDWGGFRSADATVFNIQRVADWIYLRVLDMGYDAAAFDKYEQIARYDRGARGEEHRERLGKKYQWIALQELFARLADNFWLRPEGFAERARPRHYNTSINVGHRDIDPSSLIEKTHASQYEQHPITWWAPETYAPWDKPLDPAMWLSADDHPDLGPNVTPRHEGDDWLTLLGYYEWSAPESPLKEKWKDPTPRYIAWASAYLVRKTDAAKVFRYLQHHDLREIRFMQEYSVYHLFLGEYAASPAHDEYFEFRDLSAVSAIEPDDMMPASALVFQEHGQDCSLVDSVSVAVPSDIIIRTLHLEFAPENKWRNDGGEIIAMDPSVETKGPKALVIRRSSIMSFIASSPWTLIWILNGEKQIVGGNIRGRQSGSLEVQGVYVLDRNGRLRGKSTCRYSS